MAKKLDPYAELGIDKDATAPEIKKAFRKKSKQAHPDQGGTAEDFMRVKQSHLVLSDPDRRKKFDETGDIDEQSLGTVESRANNIIAEIIALMIVGQRDPCSLDVISVIVDYLNQQIEAIDGEIKTLAGRLARAKKMAKKFKRKGKGANLLYAMTHAKEIELEGGITAAKIKKEPFTMALTIVRDYEFEVDAVPQTVNYATYTTVKFA